MMRKYYGFVLDSLGDHDRPQAKSLLKKYNANAILGLEKWFDLHYQGYKSVAVGSARFGLYALVSYLKEVSKKKVCNVILPGWSCVVVANSIRAAGCEVRFADVSLSSYGLTVDSIAPLVDQNTICIVVQHVFGVADFEEVIKIQNRFKGITVVEDCAHTLGGYYDNGLIIGSVGDYSIFSFEQSKVITAWTGGAIIARHEGAINFIKDLLLRLEAPSRIRDLKTFVALNVYFICYRKRLAFIGKYIARIISKILAIEPSMTSDERVGVFDYSNTKRLSEMQAYILNEQLKSIKERNARRLTIAKIYDREFGVNYERSASSVVLRYVLFVDGRNEIVARCKKLNINLGNWFSTPVHPVNPYLVDVGYRSGMCPNAEKLSNYVINLPCGAQIDDQDAVKISRQVNGVISEHNHLKL